VSDRTVTSYYHESLVPDGVAERQDYRNQYSLFLLDLMASNDFEVCSGVRCFEAPEGHTPYPLGYTIMRAEVDVYEYDIEVEPSDDCDD
jgi:hypothetical protein